MDNPSVGGTCPRRLIRAVYHTMTSRLDCGHAPAKNLERAQVCFEGVQSDLH